jgi:hypothetical protein
MIKDLPLHYCIPWFSAFGCKKILPLDAFSHSLLEPDVYNRPLHSSYASLPPTHPYYNSLFEVYLRPHSPMHAWPSFRVETMLS